MRHATFHCLWMVVLPFVLVTTSLAAVSDSQAQPATNLEQRERQLSRTLKRASLFEEVPHITWLWSCEEIQSPVALATPDPMLTPAGRGKIVKVSFIIGTDGHVHSPLILESAGIIGDRHVLDTVRRWRYRPATCNGVPTEIEGKIEFSIR